jgi:2,4-dienoyl-CoA reductase-like NADH-dependent reductase (Old Yellow Enzyme family)/thioredoxin reductase
MIHIWDDKFLESLMKLTQAVHDAGGKIGIQLWQGGPSAGLADPQSMFIVPSDIEVRGHNFPGASIETIHSVIDAFGTAAKRAEKAGFDCVEFHVGHGYSPHCFMSAAMNRRTDKYGGSLENRARYSLEILKSIRKNISETMPLFMRVVAQDDYVQNGLSIEDIIEFCKMTKEVGVDVLNVSRGNKFPIPGNFGMMLEVPPIDIPRGFNIDNAARIKRETGMLTIGVGRINSPEQAEEILTGNRVDMVAIGRGQIADPEFCLKAREERGEDIVRCVGCNQGCYDKLTALVDKWITCMRNPSVGKEKEYSLVKTDSPKTVAIIGGGLAGLEAAITLKKRGHNPIIFEETAELGGQFILAGQAPRKQEMKDAALSRGEQAKRLGIEINLGTKATPEILKSTAPDVVIIATGAEPIKLKVEGAERPGVLNAFDVLSGKAAPAGDTVVIGGGLVGLEVAEYVAERKTGKVTIVEMLDSVGKELGMLRKISIMENIHKSGIVSMVNTKCQFINDGSVTVEKEGETKNLKCDTIVIAVGTVSRPYDDIKQFAEDISMPYYIIGDAKKARKAINAIAEAAEVARAV